MKAKTFPTYGAAQTRFLGHVPPGFKAEADFVTRVLASKAGQELGADVLRMAWETASMEPNLSDPVREALAYLIVASFINGAQGSTRLPVDAGDDSALAEILRQLCAPAADGPDRGDGSDGSVPLPDLAAWTTVRERVLAFLSAPLPRLLVGTRAEEYKPFLLLDRYFYHQRMHLQEDRLVTALRVLVDRPPVPHAVADLGVALQRILALPPRAGGLPDGTAIALTGDQQYAVLSAVTAPCTVVSGGPGTGKTTIVVSILRMLQRMGVPMESVALAAPTGKAAYRMGEAVLKGLSQIPLPDPEDEAVRLHLPKPSTLHRLLGFSPGSGRFRHHDNNRLAAAFVIVDEASMIDLGMMDHLFRALGPQSQLVLLGDADQLPSVEAGAVMRDLVPQTFSAHDRWSTILQDPLPPSETSGHLLSGSAVRLVNNFRMNPNDPSGRAILSVAQAVKENQSAKLFGVAGEEAAPLLRRRSSADEIEFDKVEWLPTLLAERPAGAKRREGWTVQPSVSRFLERWHAERIQGLPGFADFLARDYTFTAEGFQGADLAAVTALFGHFESFRLLCATRVFNTGADAINSFLRSLGSSGSDAAASRSSFRIGEPVLMQENDYENGLFNGDQGIVLRVKSAGAPAHPMVVFLRDGAFFPLHLESLHARLRTAYAMTVHKSQGSEYDHVAFLMPDEDLPLLTREILYTAVTRAKKSVVLIGSEALLRASVGRAVLRFTGIREKLERGAR